MAVYFLRSKHVSRGNGSRVTRAAAYRAGERIRDERTSEVYDYSDRRDVAHKEIVLPGDLAEHPDMEWAKDRATLWNAAEHAGLRRNSRLAREWLAILPHELSSERRVQLARSFAKELADRYRCAVDVCVHEPRPRADARNHHVHLLMTHREVTPEGMGRRTNLELGGRERHQMGLEGSARDEYVGIRERWARLTNEALHRAGLSARIDHQSLQKQGINREPAANIPEKVFYAEQRSGKESIAGNAIRARHRERMEARLEGTDALGRVIQRQKAALAQAKLADSTPHQDGAETVRWGALTREERNEKRRERYRARRAIEKQDSLGEEKRRKAKLEQYHARVRRAPEVVREERRRYRVAHSEEINRKQREYRKAHSAELALKRREYRQRRGELEKQQQRERRKTRKGELTSKPRDRVGNRTEQERTQERGFNPRTNEQPVYESRAQTADESVKRWLEYRQRHGPGRTAEESARAWQALREREKSADTSKGPASPAFGEHHQSTPTDDDDIKPKKQRSHDHDMEF